MPMATEFAVDGLDDAVAGESERGSATSGCRDERRPPMAGWIVAAVFALVAVAEAGWIGRAELTRAAVSPPPPVPVVVESLQGGDTVIVDGREVGVTPLTLALTSGMRSIRVRTRPTVDQAVAAPEAPAVARPADTARRGSADPRGLTRAPRRTAPVVANRTAGARRGTRARIERRRSGGDHRGKTRARFRQQRVRLSVAPGRRHQGRPNRADEDLAAGRPRQRECGAVGAGLDQRESLVGDTPLGNLPLPVGEHEITFRHPQLGEQTQKVIVKSGALTRVSASLAR